MYFITSERSTQSFSFSIVRPKMWKLKWNSFKSFTEQSSIYRKPKSNRPSETHSTTLKYCIWTYLNKDVCERYRNANCSSHSGCTVAWMAWIRHNRMRWNLWQNNRKLNVLFWVVFRFAWVWWLIYMLHKHDYVYFADTFASVWGSGDVWSVNNVVIVVYTIILFVIPHLNALSTLIIIWLSAFWQPHYSMHQTEMFRRHITKKNEWS